MMVSAAWTFAAGFSILEQSPSGMGRALAGMTAETTDPSALYFNPSAVAWFERPSLVLGNHVLTGNVRFHDDGSTMDGTKSGDIIGTSFIPNVAFVYPIQNGLTLNFNMSATSGTETNYPWAWMGRYFARDTSIAVIEMQPSVSYRLTDTLSIGFGVMIAHSAMEMKQALDVPAAGLSSNDSRLKLKGDDWAYGFTAGLTWKIFEKTTVGLGYRSKMTYDVDGDARFTGGYGEIYHLMLGDSGFLSMTSPQNANFGIIQEIGDAWKVMLDLSWTDWSVMDEMKIKFKDAGVESVETMKWHDNWRIALGTEYRVNEKWCLRFGVAFDERTVTKTRTKTCKLPDSNRYWISAGTSYQCTPNLRLDLSLTHLIFQPSSIQQTHTDGGYINGEFKGYTDLVSFGIKYDF